MIVRVAERVQVREIDPAERQKLLLIMHRPSRSVGTYPRADGSAFGPACPGSHWLSGGIRLNP